MEQWNSIADNVHRTLVHSKSNVQNYMKIERMWNMMNPLEFIYPIEDDKEQNDGTQDNSQLLPQELLKKNDITIDDVAKEIYIGNIFRKQNEVLYVYSYTNGYYFSITPDNLENIIRCISPKKYLHLLNRYNLREIYSWLDYYSMNISENVSQYAGVNFNDGFYDLISGCFYLHSPDRFLTYKLPINYEYQNVSSMDTPIFDKFLRDISCGNHVIESLLLEHLAYVIGDNRCLKLITILYGTSNTGKSIWLDLLAHATGANNTTNIPLEQLPSNFMTINLLNKRLNAYSEIGNKRLDNIYILKALSGNDTIKCDVKYGNAISFKNKAALVFSTNTLEPLKCLDPGNALFERFLIIPFFNQIPREQQDPYLVEKLVRELPTVIKKYIIDSGLLKKLHNNFYNFTYILEAINMKFEFLNPLTSVELFAIECLDFVRGAKIHKQALYDAYTTYCYNNKLVVMSKSDFCNYVKNYHRNSKTVPVEENRFRLDGDNKHGYINVRLK